MRAQKSFLISVMCVFLGVIPTISLALPAADDLSVDEFGAGAKLVIVSVSGPTTASHNELISLTYYVENQGTEASDLYKVGLYLSTDKKIDPAVDRLLDKVTFSKGLAAGEIKKATSKVLVPTSGLSGKYYYGAVVGSSKKASSKLVSLVRYSLAADNETVTDHQTGLRWQQTDDGTLRNWDDAKKYCANLVLGGYEDWVLPMVGQLQSIVDYSRYNPAIDPVFECHSGLYWTRTTSAGYPDYAWGVDGYIGGMGGNIKSGENYVRCVRVGP